MPKVRAVSKLRFIYALNITGKKGIFKQIDIMGLPSFVVVFKLMVLSRLENGCLGQ